MMRSFLALVSVAVLSPVVSAQTCTDGRCPVPQFRPIQQAVKWTADQVRGPVYGSTGVPQVTFSGVPQPMAETRRPLFPRLARVFGR